MTSRVASCEECGWIADASLVEFGKCPRSCATELRYYPVRSAEVNREELERVLRERMQNSNFTDIKHEPLRTQVIDQWVQVFADAVLALLNGEAS